MALYGAIEAGGTKFVCAVASGPDAVHSSVTIPATTPQETLATVADWFRQYQQISGRTASGKIGVGGAHPHWLSRGVILSLFWPGRIGYYGGGAETRFK